MEHNLATAALDLSSGSEKSVQLGFVDLGTDLRPVQDKVYPIISASNAIIENLPVPATNFKTINIDILLFYINHLPDFWGGSKDGLFKISVNTRDPQSAQNTENEATIAIDFSVKDGNYAPGFLHRGLYRNVIINNWINLKFDLFELDTDTGVYYDKVKGIVDNIPGIKNLDILNGIPYLNMASKLFEGIIKTFGKNADDHIWGEIPILEINPSIGGAFLRNGLYLVFENTNKQRESIQFENLSYKNNLIQIANKTIKHLPNHLLFNIGIMPYTYA